MNRRDSLAAMLGTVVIPPWASNAWAQAAPVDKTLRIVVGFPAGGAGDAIARMLVPHLRTTMRRPSSSTTGPAPAAASGLRS